MTDLRPAETLLLQVCLIGIVAVGLLTALLLIWMRRGKS